MNNEIKITVIVPAYNVEQWLSRCIESIIRQTHHNLEIIVINDGSTDGTGRIINQYAAVDSRIVPVHQENQGVVASREHGIRLATGSYIGFVDSDDEIEEDMYECLLNNAIHYRAQISQCGIMYCFNDGRKVAMHGTKKISVYDRITGYRELMRGTHMEPSLCNKIYKKELFVDCNVDDSISQNEDFLQNAILFNQVERSVFEDFCRYHYWRREGSASNNDKIVQNRTNILKARKIVMDIAPSDVWNYAFEGYMAALIGTYNLLIGNKNVDAVWLCKVCKKNLHQSKVKFKILPGEMRCKAYAILYCSFIYDLVYKIRCKMLHTEICRQVKESR